MKNKQITIYQDQRIAEEFCNFRCEYCGGLCPKNEYTTKKDSKGNFQVPNEWHEMMNKMPKIVKKYFDSGINFENYYHLSFDIMENTKNIMETDILKISGGELTLNPNLCEFVKSIHNKYLSIQILSNGYNLKKEDIIKYKEMKNVSFQISLDGVTPETNYSKSHSKFITNMVLDNIDFMLKNNIGVEINCVLTKYNTDKFIDFLECFKNAKNFIVVPRPVRGIARKTIDFSKSQIEVFEKTIIGNYDKYCNILPPVQYFERLIDIMKRGKRNYPCYIPYFVQSIDGYGNFEMCPLGLMFDKIKNIMDNSVNEQDILINSDYNINNNYSLCEYCIVQYEMFNLFVENKIEEEGLKKLPSLNNDVIISHIKNIKELIIMKKENNLKKEICDKYDLIINNIEKNEDSTDGNVYMLYTEENRYVAKVYDDLQHVKSMINLHNDLGNNGIDVPKIIKCKSGESYITLNNRCVVIYSFLEGIQLGEKFKDLPEEVIQKIAIELNKFHSITSNSNYYDLNKMPFECDKKVDRYSALHFDLTRMNIFYNEDKKEKIGFIDFDDAKYGASICDVAIASANLFFSKSRGADVKGFKLFIDSYYGDNIELKEKELPFIKKFAIAWIDYIMDGNEFDTSTTESFIVRKDLIEKYMDL